MAFAAVLPGYFSKTANIRPVATVIPVTDFETIKKSTAAGNTGAVDGDTAIRLTLCPRHVDHANVVAKVIASGCQSGICYPQATVVKCSLHR